MNKEEWDILSEESKWNLFKKNFTSLNLMEELGEIDFTKEKWRKIYNYLTKDTREDNSDECWYDEDDEMWYYINPFNKKQSMYVDDNGFHVHSRGFKWKSNKDLGKKSVWQKVERIDELKEGDFVKVNDKYDENYATTKGILYSIDEDELIIQYFNRYGVIHCFIVFSTANVEKAVLVGEIKDNINKDGSENV
jgi:hypothetical protein